MTALWGEMSVYRPACGRNLHLPCLYTAGDLISDNITLSEKMDGTCVYAGFLQTSTEAEPGAKAPSCCFLMYRNPQCVGPLPHPVVMNRDNPNLERFKTVRARFVFFELIS
jgi:hypothetical protein